VNASVPKLVVHGELSIASPTDEFLLRGDHEKLTLTGPSLRSFLRLRRQASRAVIPEFAEQLRASIRGRSSFVLECRCRERTIATVAGDDGGITIRSHRRQILRTALRL
jgi:hypothetical protein